MVFNRRFFVLTLIVFVLMGLAANFADRILAAVAPTQQIQLPQIRITLPVCGDGKCEGTEDAKTCPKDCWEQPQDQGTTTPDTSTPDAAAPAPQTEPETDGGQPAGGGGTIFCTDSDGGNVPGVQGLISSNTGQFTDTCISETTLNEYFCRNDVLANEFTDCGAGNHCLNGSCIPEEQPPTEQPPAEQPAVPEEAPAITDDAQPTAEGKLEPSDFILSDVSSGAVLNQDAGTIEVFPETWIKIYLPDVAIRKPIRNVTATIGNTTMVLRETASYEGAIPAPTEMGQHELSVTVDYQDATSETLSYEINVVPASQAAQTTDGALNFIDNPTIERITETIIVPLVTIVAVANVAIFGAMTATGFPYLMYLYSLLTHPTQLIARRKRKKWGVVFDSLTRLPVDLTIVRLLDAKTGHTMRSTVTDREGRYIFIVEPGQYKLAMAKAGFKFPSTYLKGQSEAISYADLYHGETLDMTKETALTKNVPTDPTAKEKTPRQIMLAAVGRSMQFGLGIASIVVMVGAMIIVFNPFVVGMFFVNVLAFLLFRRLSVTRKPKSWGVVSDQETNGPLHRALVRIFDSRYNKLLETKITNAKGQYAFLVGRNKYDVTFEKKGYQKAQEGPIDLTDAKHAKEAVVEMDVGLQPEDD